MSTFSGDSVTMDRNHFETILQRANECSERHHNGDPKPVLPNSFMYIPADEVERLVGIARQFSNLKHNLIVAGGVTEEIVNLMCQENSSSTGADVPLTPSSSVANHGEGIQDEGNQADSSVHSHMQPHIKRQALSNLNQSLQAHYPVQARTLVSSLSYDDGLGQRPQAKHTSFYRNAINTRDPGSSQLAPAVKTTSQVNTGHSRRRFVKSCMRSVILTGIGNDVKYWDVTSVIHGGPLLQVDIRRYSKTVHVSFVHEEDAARFYEHANNNGIFIKGRVIAVKWSEDQYTLNQNTLTRLACGATRNLVLEGSDSNITEATIRSDLEHIDKLVIIKIEFLDGRCYIKTNSVHRVNYARMCMQSRGMYKRTMIGWDVDECDTPFDITSTSKPNQYRQPNQQKTVSNQQRETKFGSQSRFSPLRLDDNDNLDEDEEDDTSIAESDADM